LSRITEKMLELSNFESLLENACVENNLNTFNNTIQSITTVVMNVFWNMCAKGHLDIAKALVKKFHLNGKDIRSNDHKALKLACENAHFDLVTWMIQKFSLNSLDVNSNDYCAFRYACAFEKYDIAVWIAKEFEINIDEKLQCIPILTWLYINKHLEAFKWLLETFEISDWKLNYGDDSILVLVCTHGDLEIVKYLVTKFRFTKYDFLERVNSSDHDLC